jgi:hypothetical protein
LEKVTFGLPEREILCPGQGMRVPGKSESRREIIPFPSQTWLGPWLLLVCLLVSRSIAEEVSEHCSHMIGKGHLQFLQQLVSVWPCLFPTGETETWPREQVKRGVAGNRADWALCLLTDLPKSGPQVPPTPTDNKSVGFWVTTWGTIA